MVNLKEENIILFDGVCNLCDGVVKFIIAKDKNDKFKFTSLQSASGQSLLLKLNLPTDSFTSIVLIIGDCYFVKSLAVLQVLKELGGFWKLFYIFIIFPRPVRDFVYDLVAKTRYKLFGKRESCSMPTNDIKHKFLE
ncbi:MAG: thiol-disulfide oxidoreductase DCC family protein [Flavobacteriaceae bacterium]|nr:thiol-disulfide oxidoreductase DCC family protein [Flavobacteriaceae bacterium]